ncbi:universal stress protein UspA, partial [Prosthecomicrobium hirschii]
IVVSSHRPSMATYLIGSNAAKIVRHAPCSVMVVRD